MVTIRAFLMWLGTIYVLSVRSNAVEPDWENWMKLNIKWISKLKLMQICLPGANEAGMNKISGGIKGYKSCNTRCQSMNILKQLKHGVRYLDLRPVITDKGVRTGHYQNVTDVGWRGGYGQDMESIVKQINSFTKDHNELIIASLSRALNVASGDQNIKPFEQGEWDNLFKIIAKTDNLYEGPENTLLEVTLGTMTNNGNKSTVFYVVNEPNITLGSYAGKGIFDQKSLKLYDDVADTDKLNFMYVDQSVKMRKMAPNSFFVFSWIVTQQPRQIDKCPKLRSIKSLAKKTNPKMNDIMYQVTQDAYPNVISANYIEFSKANELSMAINAKWIEVNNFA